VADRRDQKEALRAQRVERERAAAAAQRRRRLVIYAVAGVIALAAAGLAAAFTLGGGDGEPQTGGLPDGSEVPARRETNLQRAAEAAGCVLRRETAEGEAEHREGDISYRDRPPHSGPHNPVPAEDGAYSEAPPQEQLVHSLEHGRIVVQFRPDVSDEVKGGLKALFDEDPVHVILVPDQSGMKWAVAATAWTDPDAGGPKPSYGRTLGCPEMNDRVYDALRAFRDSFRDRGPEYVP
jgi:hypothetical protein